MPVNISVTLPVAHASSVVQPSIIDDLLSRVHEFSFPQVLRLVRACLGPDALERNRARVRPKLSLAFPAADIARVDKDGDNLRVTTTFLALYGA